MDYREFPVLYVDDEPENLRIFELTFRREFSILTAASGEEGLEVINTRPVALVLSDHRMPGMTGVEFLARASELDPKTVRILVTAYGDAETLGSAINNGSIYRFVAKPWTPEEMRVTLRRGVEVYALDRERSQLLRELTLLNRVSKTMNQELDTERLLDLLLQTVTDDFGYDAATVLFFDARGERLTWSRMRPDDGQVSGRLQEIEIDDKTAPGFLERLREGEPQVLHVQDALGLDGAVRRWVTEVAAEEILVAPLVGKRGTMGALAVDDRRGGARFDTDDRTRLEGLANQAVVALENARLVEDLRRSRAQVQQASRLGTLGTLAAGLAHEINNPLVSIHTFLSMAPAKRREDDPEFWQDYHAVASAEVDRIRRLVETMRQLGRGGDESPPREAVQVGELALEVIRLLEREARRADVHLALERDPETPKIVGVRDHLHQVIMNLLLNAIDASPAGGEVAVRIQPDPECAGCRIEVSDQGSGIPEENLERVFEPFFTTKGPDQGTGLGLMICHRIVADHDGNIEVRSAEGQGATFCVTLPPGQARGQESR